MPARNPTGAGDAVVAGFIDSLFLHADHSSSVLSERLLVAGQWAVAVACAKVAQADIQFAPLSVITPLFEQLQHDGACKCSVNVKTCAMN